MAAKKSSNSNKSGKGLSRSKKNVVHEPKNRGKGDDEEMVDGRSDRRVPIQLLVDYKADGHYLFDFCKDLGSGGVFIQTKQPLPTGANLDLTFTIPDSKETLTARGTVIWVQSPVAERKDLTPGMGIQFQGFSGPQRKLLEDFVQRYHGMKGGNPQSKAS